VAAVAGSLVLVIGSVAVANSQLSLGDLLAFYAVIGLLLRTVAGGSGAGGAADPEPGVPQAAARGHRRSHAQPLRRHGPGAL